VFRDGVQVWPKLRKKNAPEPVKFHAPVSENEVMGDPEDEPDPD